MAEETKKTLFVRNLPFDTTNDSLEKIFGEIGPIKSCFVVKNKDTGQCRGFGFVKYSMREDAETAKKSIQTIDGRKLAIHYADKKVAKKKNKMKGAPLADDDDSDDEEISPKKSEDKSPIKTEQLTKGDKVKQEISPEKLKREASKSQVTEKQAPTITATDPNAIAKEKHRAACTVIVKNFQPDLFETDVRSVLIGQKNQRQVHYPVPDRDSNVAAILMKSKRDAHKAAKKLDKMKIKGDQISAQLLSVERAVAKTPQQPKKCRLIIRNMSFKCTEDKVKEAFAKFGEVTDVTLPKKPNGLMLGFGFVQFSTMAQANIALKQMNAKPLLGRPIAVDWAVAKNKYEEIMKKGEEESSDSGSFSSEGEAAVQESSEEQEESSEEQEEESSEEQEELMDVTESSSSSESDSESESDPETSSDEAGDSTEMRVKDTGSETDSESESDDEGFGKDEEKRNKFSRKPSMKSDVDQGKTVFIRNLSYDTEDDGLEECFEQFGELKYCRVVVDPNTEHSRGTAFVQFKQKVGAEKALEAADPAMRMGLTLDGRRLNVTLALPRDQAVKLQAVKKQKDEKDNRNLSLAREGLIRPGTQDADGLSSADLNKRLKIEQSKRQKLKNPNLFISPTRLCVHNIPVSVDDKQLRRMFFKYLPDKSARITECRIMRDLSRVNTKGVAKSRGYGFVEVNEHKHALELLRATNNNPALFGDKRRLIIEFSLENRVALATKEKRLERAKAKQETLQKGKDTFVDVKSKKKNRRDNRNRQTIRNPVMVTAAMEQPENGPVKKPKGLPSHWGPKVRDRNRVQNQRKPNTHTDSQSQHNPQVLPQKRKRENRTETMPKKRVRKREVHDNLDVLVNKYRQQFSKVITKAKGSGQHGQRSKWFDS